jgi:predicted RNA-binding Zn-ribbon protein involved in translation (DUF1610 family)
MEPAAARLHCPACGEVEVDLAGVEVHVNPVEDVAVFTFACPGCLELVVGGCRETIASLLVAGARRYELRSTSAPALTLDDLLDLHEWLERDEPWPQAPSADR